MDEPLLFPIKRAGQPEIHLAKLLREFFEFKGGKCLAIEISGEIQIKMENDWNYEAWTISENRGKSFPFEARNLKPDDPEYLKLKDAELVKSLRKFISNYKSQKIDLAKIIAIGGERSRSSSLDSIEEFHPDNKSWTLGLTTLAEERYGFGRVVVDVETICPT